MSDTYSQVDTTEKVVEEQVVNESLLASQRIINLRPANIDPQDTNTPPRDERENKDEPCYWSEMNLQDIGLEFHADEETHLEKTSKGILTKLNL